jgi:hypothetical protein
LLENIVDENKINSFEDFQHGRNLAYSRAESRDHSEKRLNERGQNVTAVGAVGGLCLPSMLICLRKKMKSCLSFGASPGTYLHYEDKGWVDSESIP